MTGLRFLTVQLLYQVQYALLYGTVLSTWRLLVSVCGRVEISYTVLGRVATLGWGWLAAAIDRPGHRATALVLCPARTGESAACGVFGGSCEVSELP